MTMLASPDLAVDPPKSRLTVTNSIAPVPSALFCACVNRDVAHQRSECFLLFSRPCAR